jgi:site-specific DNA-methyltransferase (adenine-specific)
MLIIPLDSTSTPPNRQRKEFSDAAIRELADSILHVGLLHPPVFRSLPSETGSVYQLVVGERRLRAIRLLDSSFRCDGAEVPRGSIAVTLLDEMPILRRREAELHENIMRVDLTWQEKAQAEADLHKLRKEQNPEQTLEQTGEELASLQVLPIPSSTARDNVWRSTILAENLHRPEVANARSVNEAMKAVYANMEADFTNMLARKLKPGTSDQLLLEGDMQVLMRDLSGFDCIIADPPYGIEAHEHGDAGAAHEYEDTKEYGLALARWICACGYAATNPQAHLYLFCDFDHFALIRDQFLSYWQCQRTPIIWYKGSVGHNPIPAIGFRRTYECILFAYKGNKPCKGLVDDVISIRPDFDQTHAASKPVELYQKLLARTCVIGDRVLDPCCGSGTIFPAAASLSLKATGIELDPRFANLARARMNGKV